jgi:hypothetical protein
MSNLVSPTGYVDLDNDCEYSIDRKSTRSRESINPKEDLAFYFNTYIVPKYGLDNLNVSNVASFMKELEMNWTKLSPDLRNKVMDILVDGILNKDSNFKTSLMQKMGINLNSLPVTQPPPPVTQQPPVQQNFKSVSKFGMSNNNKLLVGIVIAIILYFVLFKKNRIVSYGRLS